MPIVYIHGVANRDPDDFTALETMLQRYIADELKNPQTDEEINILKVYWGDLGASFAWDFSSCLQAISLRLMGAATDVSSIDRAKLMAELDESVGDLPSTDEASSPSDLFSSGLITTGFAPPAASQTIRLKDLSTDELSDLAIAVIISNKRNTWQQTLAVIAADDVATEPKTFTLLAAQDSVQDELEVLLNLIEKRYTELEVQRTDLIEAGPGWLGDLKDRFNEAMERGDQATGYALTRVLNRFRPELNKAVIIFFGDVFAYLTHRGTIQKPDAITERLLVQLEKAHKIKMERNGEPIVLLSHSMGGQIAYDTLTYFLPQMEQYKHIKVDFWCATASQVGVFEEMKLFAVSDPQINLASDQKVPLPSQNQLGYWWNVWDPNDYLSYTANPIFENIDDESYNSGTSLIQAHSGYLQRPSFYRKFAEKLRNKLPARP
ncbi:hypothetical protein [Dyadobacter diqingensis]|uniref:hypothetical protein n=1 Tax=Dyadobacter diqingensis TaxID=2938121 RepID=UPI0020C190BA|nr:hypothetical protein [Dyadobacter diqingensis]